MTLPLKYAIIQALLNMGFGRKKENRGMNMTCIAYTGGRRFFIEGAVNGSPFLEPVPPVVTVKKSCPKAEIKPNRSMAESDEKLNYQSGGFKGIRAMSSARY